MILYNYECPYHGVFDAWSIMIERDTPKLCPKCSSRGSRKVTAPLFKLPGHDTSWPTAADKWEKWHIKEAKKEPN